MAYLNKLDPFLEAVRTGKYAGKACYDFTCVGRNPDVDTGASEDVWSYGGLFTAPTTARVHNVSSSDVNDDGSPAGTGARTVQIFGVTSAGLESEIVTMDGTTTVATTKSYYDIYKMIVYTAGSGGTNAGTISARAQTDGTVTASISINGYNTSFKAIRFVPAGYSAYIFGWNASMSQPTTGYTAEVALYTKFSSGVWIGQGIHTLVSLGTSSEHDLFNPPLVVPAESWIKLTAVSVSNNNTIVEGQINILLVED